MSISKKRGPDSSSKVTRKYLLESIEQHKSLPDMAKEMGLTKARIRAKLLQEELHDEWKKARREYRRFIDNIRYCSNCNRVLHKAGNAKTGYMWYCISANPECNTANVDKILVTK